MKCDIFPADTAREAVKSHQAGLASVHTPILFTAKKTPQKTCDHLLFGFCFTLRCKVSSDALQRVLAHLSEVNILRGGEVEALLVALMLQQTLREPVRHLHVAAVVLLRVQGGVGQHGGRLLHVAGVQERCVVVKFVRLHEDKRHYLVARRQKRVGWSVRTEISQQVRDESVKMVFDEIRRKLMIIPSAPL